MSLTQIYNIQKIGKGFLAIMPRPQAGELIEYEFSGLALLGVTLITSMLEPMEATKLGLQAESEYCKTNDIEFLSFPIADRGLPKDIGEFVKLSQYLHKKAQQGAGVAIHCRLGIGRSGLLAVAILLREGLCTEEALEKVSLARQVKVPDTKEQLKWLQENQRILQR